jgi:hypothetical protein
MLNTVYFLGILFVKPFKESFGFRVSGLGLGGKGRERRAMKICLQSLFLTPPTFPPPNFHLSPPTSRAPRNENPLLKTSMGGIK